MGGSVKGGFGPERQAAGPASDDPALSHVLDVLHDDLVEILEDAEDAEQDDDDGVNHELPGLVEYPDEYR